MTEMKSCPFCGGSAEFKPYKRDGLTLKCSSLGCVVFNQRTMRYGLDWLQQKMTEHWETRAAQTKADERGSAQPAFYVADSDVERLKDRMITGRGCFLSKYPKDGHSPYFTNPNTAQARGDKPNFCARCGKRLGAGVHTCSPPRDAPQEPMTDEQILACLDERQPTRSHHGAAVFEYRLFALIDFARRVLAVQGVK